MKKAFLLKLKKRLLCAYEKGDVEEIAQIADFLKLPNLETEEYYKQEKFTGYASIDKPHIKYFKKGTLDAKLPEI